MVASALNAGIVNQISLFIAPKIIGGVDAKPIVGGFGIEKMSDALQLKNRKVRVIGDDLLVEYDI